MRDRRKTNYAQFDAFQNAIAKGEPNDWRCRAGSRYLYICEDGLVHYCSQQRGYPGVPVRAVHEGGCGAGVFDGEELRAELHHWLRAPDLAYRPLAGTADAGGFAGERGVGGDTGDQGLGTRDKGTEGQRDEGTEGHIGESETAHPVWGAPFLLAR